MKGVTLYFVKLPKTRLDRCYWRLNTALLWLLDLTGGRLARWYIKRIEEKHRKTIERTVKVLLVAEMFQQ